MRLPGQCDGKYAADEKYVHFYSSLFFRCVKSYICYVQFCLDYSIIKTETQGGGWLWESVEKSLLKR